MSAQNDNVQKITTLGLKNLKSSGEEIASLTAYDSAW